MRVRATNPSGNRAGNGHAHAFVFNGRKVGTLPDLKKNQIRCPVCRNAAYVLPSGYLRKHADPFGHDCYNRKPPAP